MADNYMQMRVYIRLRAKSKKTPASQFSPSRQLTLMGIAAFFSPRLLFGILA